MLLIFFGYLADRWQRRFFIFWGMLLASIFLSCLGIANNIFTLVICLLLGHMGVSFFHPQATSFAYSNSECKTNSKELSIFIAMGTFGYALGPAISSGIILFCFCKYSYKDMAIKSEKHKIAVILWLIILECFSKSFIISFLLLVLVQISAHTSFVIDKDKQKIRKHQILTPFF